MTNEEAKFILSAYRPNGQDASDPAMAEALEQAARDPELAAWFQEERARDTIISEKLQEVVVPSGLKSTILAGHRMMAQPGRSRSSRSKWGWAAGLRVAAIIILSLGLYSFFVTQSPSTSRLGLYRADMTQLLATKAAPLDYHGRSLSEVRRWLAGTGVEDSFEISPALSSQPTMGCQILEWNGAQVTLVCFDTGDGQLAHLLVVDRAIFPQLDDLAAPELSQEEGWTTASWTSEDRLYLLAGKGRRPELSSLL